MVGQRKMAVEIARGANSSSKYALRCSATRHNKPPAAAARITSRANFLASLGEYGENMCLYGGYLSVNVKTHADEMVQAAAPALLLTVKNACDSLFGQPCARRLKKS